MLHYFSCCQWSWHKCNYLPWNLLYARSVIQILVRESARLGRNDSCCSRIWMVLQHIKFVVALILHTCAWKLELEFRKLRCSRWHGVYRTCGSRSTRSPIFSLSDQIQYWHSSHLNFLCIYFEWIAYLFNIWKLELGIPINKVRFGASSLPSITVYAFIEQDSNSHYIRHVVMHWFGSLSINTSVIVGWFLHFLLFPPMMTASDCTESVLYPRRWMLTLTIQ